MTQDNIARGIRSNSSSCLIALAIAEAGKKNVKVTGGQAAYDGRVLGVIPKRVKKRLPALARSFIMAFDSGVKVRPIEFEL